MQPCQQATLLKFPLSLSPSSRPSKVSIVTWTSSSLVGYNYLLPLCSPSPIKQTPPTLISCHPESHPSYPDQVITELAICPSHPDLYSMKVCKQWWHAGNLGNSLGNDSIRCVTLSHTDTPHTVAVATTALYHKCISMKAPSATNIWPGGGCFPKLTQKIKSN